MDITQFWQLIDRTRVASGGDNIKHAELLTDELAQLPEEEIVEYQHIFDTLVRRAERDDILEVADFIYGGLGDDGWKDFRAWLVGQGQMVYENMLADPESLVDVVGTLERLNITAELLSYAARHAFEGKRAMKTFPTKPLMSRYQRARVCGMASILLRNMSSASGKNILESGQSLTTGILHWCSLRLRNQTSCR
jgi:hypothetical protein